MSVPLVLADLAAACRLAGAEILSWYAKSDVGERQKADASPVTGADLAANAVLLEELPRLAAVPVVSEETVTDEAKTLALIATAPRFWLIDPLDGTRDFLARTGDFTVNAALMADGRPVAGCIHAPVRGVTLVAARGAGVFRQDADGGPLKPVRCRKPDPRHFVCLVSRQHQAGECEKLACAFPDSRMQAVGSALKYALIAAGEADVAVRKTATSLWDTAAAQCVLEEAGGALLDFAGKALVYRTGSLVNPPFVALGDPTFPWRSLLAALKD